MIIVDVYIWRLKADIGSVGHVMVTMHCSKNVFLSQYPHPPGGSHAPGGPNYHYSFDQTYLAQARPASVIYMVTLPNDRAFKKMVEDQRRRKSWVIVPHNANQTHCARAASDALIAGGLQTLSLQDNGGSILPDELDAYLGRIAFLQAGVPPTRNWTVRQRSGFACAR
jgi:hypothetical protein